MYRTNQHHPVASNYPLLFFALLIPLTILPGCGNKTDLRFASPVATFRTYQQALIDRDWELLWDCHSNTYKTSVATESQDWIDAWKQKGEQQVKAERRREIAGEEIINDRIGYLLFDATTLPSKQTSPFFYFVRDPEGWKITTHLDSLFHQELERAIARGEFKLPDD